MQTNKMIEDLEKNFCAALARRMEREFCNLFDDEIEDMIVQVPEYLRIYLPTQITIETCWGDCPITFPGIIDRIFFTGILANGTYFSIVISMPDFEPKIKVAE